MKKRLALGIGLLILSCKLSSFAYEPDAVESAELTAIKDQITPLIEGNQLTLWHLYQQARDLQPFFQDEKTSYYLEHLRDYLLTKLQTRKERIKFESQEARKNFLEIYQLSGLALADSLSENCLGRYPTLDSMSFAYDFPTPLTLAVWFRESNCGYYLPKNGNGPFQITTKDYGTWAINRAIFETTVEDFLVFAKRKIERYNSKNPETPILLSYKNFNYADLYKFAGLYNGLSGGTVYGAIGPAIPKYFFEKMPWSFEQGKRNGLFPQFLRVLEWELHQ